MSAAPLSRTARRRQLRRRRVAVVAVFLVVAALLVTWGTRDVHHPATTSSTTSSTVAPTTSSTTSTTTTTEVVTTTSTTLGSTQTATRPSAASAALTARLSGIFRAIVANQTSPARALFFPESVYVSMKAGILANPRADYADRLWAFFSLDVAAYHRAMASPQSAATLIAINGDGRLATWIPPGYCENHFGYWHLPNVRIVYRDHGVRSYAIASLISWRGEWFVIHLGPNPRPSNVGTVALPSNGPGVPGPGGGC